MWIHLPSQFCPSAPATAESILASSSLVSALARSCTWKTKSLPPKSWHRVLRTVCSTTRLSGLIYEPSTLDRGAAKYIASLPDIPALHLVRQANSSAQPIPVTSGRKLRGSSASANRSSCSSKTSTPISGSDLNKSGLSYADLVTRWRSAASARRKLGRATFANGYSHWPSAESCGNHPGATDSLTGAARTWNTPTGSDHKVDRHGMATYGKRTSDQRLRNQASTWITPHGFGGVDRKGKVAGGAGEFAKQVLNWRKQWATPQAHDVGQGNAARARRGSSKAGCRNLTDDVMLFPAAVGTWPTPRANDYKSGEVSDGTFTANARPLSEWASRFALPAPTISTPGAISSAATRSLNPRFVELLILVPLGWTDCAPLATAWFRWWLRSQSLRLRAALELFSDMETPDELPD